MTTEEYLKWFLPADVRSGMRQMTAKNLAQALRRRVRALVKERFAEEDCQDWHVEPDDEVLNMLNTFADELAVKVRNHEFGKWEDCERAMRERVSYEAEMCIGCAQYDASMTEMYRMMA
ncbi:hypothetical protein ACR77U_13160, partial [Enterococcus faecium]|uniref:hypothetical protein n=1 Tax=Enterococcus faecium TaxID=1352 RepID=UPI003DA6C4F5